MSVGESMTIGQVLQSLPSYSLLAQGTGTQTHNPSQHVNMSHMGYAWATWEPRGYEPEMEILCWAHLGQLSGSHMGKPRWALVGSVMGNKFMGLNVQHKGGPSGFTKGLG